MSSPPATTKASAWTLRSLELLSLSTPSSPQLTTRRMSKTPMFPFWHLFQFGLLDMFHSVKLVGYQLEESTLWRNIKTCAMCQLQRELFHKAWSFQTKSSEFQGSTTYIIEKVARVHFYTHAWPPLACNSTSLVLSSSLILHPHMSKFHFQIILSSRFFHSSLRF